MLTKTKAKTITPVKKAKPKGINMLYVDKKCDVKLFRAGTDVGVYIDNKSPFDRSHEGWLVVDEAAALLLVEQFKKIAKLFKAESVRKN